MPPSLQIKIRLKFVIGAPEQIQVKLRSHALTVVVSTFENIRIFLQIDADEKSTGFIAKIDNAAQKFRRFRRLEVTDCGSRKINNLTRGCVKRGRQIKRLQIIGANRENFQLRK